MPKIKARVTIYDYEDAQNVIAATFIVEAATPLSAMAKFSATAKTMPYAGPVTDEPAGDPDGEDS